MSKHRLLLLRMVVIIDIRAKIIIKPRQEERRARGEHPWPATFGSSAAPDEAPITRL